MNYSARDLENQASNMSSYTGGNAYIGLGDDFLSFSGNTGSFADPINRGKLYSITLKNVSTTLTLIALLCPGLLQNAVGLIADGNFNDASGAAGLSGSGSPLPVALFNAFINYFPTICVGFKVTTSNINQFEQSLTIFKQSPFKTHASRIIDIAAYASEANPNTTLISVQESFYMDCQTVIQYPVLPSTTVTLGLFFGASLNIANALRVKASAAKTNLAALNYVPVGAGDPSGAASTGMTSYRGRR